MFSYLFITTKWFSDDGGIQTVNRKLCIELAKRNKVHVLVTDKDRPNDEEVENAKTLGISLYAEKNLLKILQTSKIDFVCTHSIFTGGYIGEIKKMDFDDKNKIKFIHFLHHDPEDVEDVKEYISDRQEKRVYKKEKEVNIASNADCIITIGELLKEKYKNEKILRTKIDYINIGMEDTKEEGYESTESPEVLISGRTSSLIVKGIDIFAKAAEMVKTELKYLDIKFVVRGEDGDLDALQDKLKQISKRSNFVIKQYTTEQLKLKTDLEKAAVCILPSRAEGYGLSAFEALSLGVPIVVSSKSGIAKFLRTLVEQKKIEQGTIEDMVWEFGETEQDYKNLADKISKTLKAQKASRETLELLRSVLLKEASWRVGAKKLEGICEKLLGIELMKNEEQGIQLFMKRVDPYLRLYDDALESAQEKIQITSIKLKKLRTKQKQMLLEKSKTVKIEILLLDPRFPIPNEAHSIASIREKEERLESGEIRKEVAEWLSVWQEYEENYKPNANDDAGLEIKLFQSLPTVNMIRADNKMFVGTFLLTKEINEHQPTFIVENIANTMGEKLFASYVEHFDNLSKYSISIDDKDFVAWLQEQK